MNPTSMITQLHLFYMDQQFRNLIRR